MMGLHRTGPTAPRDNRADHWTVFLSRRSKWALDPGDPLRAFCCSVCVHRLCAARFTFQLLRRSRLDVVDLDLDKYPDFAAFIQTIAAAPGIDDRERVMISVRRRAPIRGPPGCAARSISALSTTDFGKDGSGPGARAVRSATPIPSSPMQHAAKSFVAMA